MRDEVIAELREPSLELDSRLVAEGGLRLPVIADERSHLALLRSNSRLWSCCTGLSTPVTRWIVVEHVGDRPADAGADVEDLSLHAVGGADAEEADDRVGDVVHVPDWVERSDHDRLLEGLRHQCRQHRSHRLPGTERIERPRWSPGVERAEVAAGELVGSDLRRGVGRLRDERMGFVHRLILR